METLKRAERAEARCRKLQEALEATIEALEDIRDGGEYWRDNLSTDINDARIVAFEYFSTHAEEKKS